jgi:hypothetical protein
LDCSFEIILGRHSEHRQHFRWIFTGTWPNTSDVLYAETGEPRTRFANNEFVSGSQPFGRRT